MESSAQRESVLLCRTAACKRPRGEITSVTDGSCRRFKWRVKQNKWICRISAREGRLKNGKLRACWPRAVTSATSGPIYIEFEPRLESVHAGVCRGFSVEDLRRISALELLMRRVGGGGGGGGRWGGGSGPRRGGGSCFRSR